MIEVAEGTFEILSLPFGIFKVCLCSVCRGVGYRHDFKHCYGLRFGVGGVVHAVLQICHSEDKHGFSAAIGILFAVKFICAVCSYSEMLPLGIVGRRKRSRVKARLYIHIPFNCEGIGVLRGDDLGHVLSVVVFIGCLPACESERGILFGNFKLALGAGKISARTRAEFYVYVAKVGDINIIGKHRFKGDILGYGEYVGRAVGKFPVARNPLHKLLAFDLVGDHRAVGIFVIIPAAAAAFNFDKADFPFRICRSAAFGLTAGN